MKDRGSCIMIHRVVATAAAAAAYTIGFNKRLLSTFFTKRAFNVFFYFPTFFIFKNVE